MEIGNGDMLIICGTDTMGVQTPSGTKSVANVYFALDVSENLLSVGQLVDEGFELTFKDKACIIKDLVKVKLFIVGMRNKCFPLNWMDIKHTAYNCILSDIEMWRKRFGHVNYGSLKLMASSNLVDGLPLMVNMKKICEMCQYEK